VVRVRGYGWAVRGGGNRVELAPRQGDASANCTEFLALGTFVAYTFFKLSALAEVAEMPLAPADAQTLPWPKKVQE
jgi:hypothetical protein